MGIKGLHHTPAKMLCNNLLALAKNPLTHDATKHINTKYHFIRDHLDKADITLEHVPSKQNMEDGFTKPITFISV